MSAFTDFVRMLRTYASTEALAKALSISAINQILSSATNFALGIYLVRFLTPLEFGLYGIGFAISLFYAGVGNALFLTQMVVLTASKPPEDRLPYALRMFVLVVLFCLLTGFVVAIVLVIGGVFSAWLEAYGSFGWAVLCASIAFLLKDFFVRHAYIVRRELLALQINTIVALALTILLCIKLSGSGIMNAKQALFAYAISNLLGGVAGFLLARLPLENIDLVPIVKDAREAWHGGVWATGGTVVNWLQSQSYIYVLGIFAGPAGVGLANAAKLLTSPLGFVLPVVNQVAMPRLCELQASNPIMMLKIGRLMAISLSILALLYFTILFIIYDPISEMLGQSYVEIKTLTVTWCIVLFLQIIRGSASTILQVEHQFRILLITNLESGVLAIFFSIALMHFAGVAGAILGNAIAEIYFSIRLWKIIARRQPIAS